MICSSTPFITGRPFTMFFNDKVYSEGAVGVAISGVPHSFHVDFPVNLKPVTPDVTITRCVPRTPRKPWSSCCHSRSCEGNLINSLDNSNPARMLLEAIEAVGIDNAKENDSYLALVQDGHVRVAVSSMTGSRAQFFTPAKAGLPDHFWGPKPRYNIP